MRSSSCPTGARKPLQLPAVSAPAGPLGVEASLGAGPVAGACSSLRYHQSHQHQHQRHNMDDHNHHQHHHHIQNQHQQHGANVNRLLPQLQPWQGASDPWLHLHPPPLYGDDRKTNQIQSYKLCAEAGQASPPLGDIKSFGLMPDDFAFQSLPDHSTDLMQHHQAPHHDFLLPEHACGYGWGDTDAPPPRPWSTISNETRESSISSSACSSFSPVQTEASCDALTVKGHDSRDSSPLKLATSIDLTLDPVIDLTLAPVIDLTQEAAAIQEQGKSLVCLIPKCCEVFDSGSDLQEHVKLKHTFPCNWAGCGQPSFASHEGLVWHVKAEHLLVCPSPGCQETSFASARVLKSHLSVAHPEQSEETVKDWQLTPKPAPSPPVIQSPVMERSASGDAGQPSRLAKQQPTDPATKHELSVATSKRKCLEQLRSVVEKKAKKNPDTPRSIGSPTDLVRNRAACRIETTNFPLVFEHAILPFLAEFMPKWGGPRHVISVSRGRTPQVRRICIMTESAMKLARRVMIGKHVFDLLPENFRRNVTLVFSTGKVDRINNTWARGLDPGHPDDICAPRNPYLFQMPCMGDSIGISGTETFKDSTATLGPCISVGGGSYWMVNFHPFLEAWQSLGSLSVEHPSRQDRDPCIAQAHDAISPGDDFKLGDLTVTSGLNLTTTRLSHDPYWEEIDKEPPLVVTDWALVSTPSSHANILRRFPSDTQPPTSEKLIKSTASVTPGATVVSSGRTSGYQRGQICESPAYVTGEENGTTKATREWYIEEPYPYDDEESWIRGGIGIEGDSGAAVIDAESGCLVGQLWGRNKYWGPGPRHTFFTPIADIFDDIQEKCGQQSRPQLPQFRDEADSYAMYPSCRQCYDLRTYLDSRRSSRISLQSMVMSGGFGGSGRDGDQDLVSSVEAVSELATPRDFPRGMGVEEVGASFNAVFSPGGQFAAATAASTPLFANDIKSPYPPTLDLGDVLGETASPKITKKRAAAWETTQAVGGESSCKKSKFND